MSSNLPYARVDANAVGVGVSIRDIIFILFRRRWIILAIALPIIILGGVSLFRQTGSHTASSRVVVELVSVDLPRWNTTGRYIDYDRELSTLFNIAMSVPVSENAALALADSLDTIKELDPKALELDEENGLRDYLLGGVDVSVVGESNILEISFSSVHPRISLMAAGALRDAFVDYQVNGRKNRKAIEYYNEQISTVRSEIDSLLALRAEIMTEGNYTSLKDGLRHESGQVADLQTKLLAATREVKKLEMDYQRLSRALQDDPRSFPMLFGESSSQTVVAWKNTVAEHEDELNRLLAIHTENSLPVARQKDLLERALQSLRSEETSYVESLGLALSSARQYEGLLKSQLAEMQEQNRRAPQVYRKVSLMDVEIKSLRDLLDDLQGKKGEVRISEMADERVSSMVVLTDPELTTVLSGSKTIVYFAVIVLFAVALGLVAAFIIDSMDHRIYAPKDVEEKLKLPVFASVSRTK